MRKLIGLGVILGLLLATGGLVFAQAPPNSPPGIETTNLVVVIPLVGTVSDDGLPSGVLDIQWILDSGPSPVWFGNDARATTPVVMFAPGTYVFRLTANDGELSSFDTTTVHIVERPSP